MTKRDMINALTDLHDDADIIIGIPDDDGNGDTTYYSIGDSDKGITNALTVYADKFLSG